MGRQGKYRGWIAEVLLLAVFLVITIVRPPLYALNDDIQLRDILSGAYTGTPDYHTVYMRAPLSFLLALLYRILPRLPWLGLFYCGCYIAGATALLRILLQDLSGKRRGQQAGMIATAVYFALSYIWLPYILPHYTTLAAYIGGIGLFLLLRRRTLSGAVFLLLCDQIRSQVFLLLCPFLLLALLCLALRKRRAEAGNNRSTWKRLALPLFFVGVYLLLLGLDRLAYLAPEWRSYAAVNEARTQLYDYTGVWDTETAHDYYRSLGVEDEALSLYVFYDLLPEPEATAERLAAMAEYEEPLQAVTSIEHIKNVLYELRQRPLRAEELSGTMTFLFLCLFAFGSVLYQKKKKGRTLRESASELLGIFCSILFYALLYAWLLWRGRTPSRVMTSLHTGTLLFLLGLIAPGSEQAEHVEGRGKSVSVLCGGVALLVLIVLSSQLQWQDILDAYQEQSVVNQTDDMLYYHMYERADSLFLVETYTAIYPTDELLRTGASSAENAILLGGWLYGSPLQRAVWERYGYEDAAALWTEEGAYFVRYSEWALTAEELQRFLDQRYGTEAVQLEPDAVLDAGDGGGYEVYRLRKSHLP